MKMGEDMLRTNTANHAKFHRCWPNSVRKKRYNYKIFFYAQRGLLGEAPGDSILGPHR